MRAGEVARRAGVSVETLRYYERRRLLPEPPRGAGGHRRYDEDAVRFVRAIKDAQAIGFTLAEIEARFPSEWVLLEDPETSEMLEVRGGKVLWHSKDRDEVYRKARELRPGRFAVRYLGTWPQNMALVL